MSQKRRTSVTGPVRIAFPKGQIKVEMPILFDTENRIRIPIPMIPQPKQRMQESIAQMLCEELELKKKDAAPIAKKILDIFEQYGYQMSDN